MGLTKQSERNVTYLDVKHYSLWDRLRNQVPGCDVMEVLNPSTKQTVTQYGWKYHTVTGRAIKLEKYDTAQKYSQRYFGYKLHLVDGGETFVIDMPYHSQVLRRFLRLAANVDWNQPVSLTVFKGRKKDGKTSGAEETGIWFHQNGNTVKSFYTKDTPNGMPAGIFDDVDQKWDFKEQHRWLIRQLDVETAPAILGAAQRVAAPAGLSKEEPGEAPQDYGVEEPSVDLPPHAPIDDDNVPF